VLFVRALLVLTFLQLSLPAHADPQVLRMATTAPDGTAWARELRAFSREVESATEGRVQVKWYFGGIAGDETNMLERIRHGQLDGAASGGPLCETLGPTMRVLRVVGLMSTASEAEHVLSRLKPRVEAEFHAQGFMLVGAPVIGPHIVFSRRPVRSLDELRKLTLWVWDRDDVMRLMLPALGVKFVSLPLPEAGRAYEEGRVDGFLAPPTVALAFQWSAQASFVSDLRVDWLTGCVAFADRAIDPLPIADRQAVRAAGAKMTARIHQVSASTDLLLMGGLFQKQGMREIPVDPRFQADFTRAAKAVRDHLDPKQIDPAALTRILGILAERQPDHAR
jgi:TRAP-type transport system periplasmic protein